MAIRFRPDRKKFEVAVALRGKRIRKLFDSKKEAKEFVRDISLRKLNLDGIQQPYPIAEAFASFIETESSQKTPRTMSSDRRFLNLALYFFTKERHLETVDEVGFEDLQLFQIWSAKPQKSGPWIKEKWSDTTVSRCAKLLKQVFKKLFRLGKIKKNPAEFWKVPHGTGLRRRPMNQEEFEVLYNAAPKWFKPILAFIRLTGSRGSSVAALTWDDIDFKTKTLKLKSRKGGLRKVKQITLPLYDELYEFMNEHLMTAPGPILIGQSMFLNKFDQPVKASEISSYGHQLIKHCGLKGVVIYSLRHAIAVDMTAADISLETTRQAMGHSNISETSNYAQGIELDSVSDAFNRIRAKTGKKIVPPNATGE